MKNIDSFLLGMLCLFNSNYLTRSILGVGEKRLDYINKTMYISTNEDGIRGELRCQIVQR